MVVMRGYMPCGYAVAVRVDLVMMAVGGWWMVEAWWLVGGRRRRPGCFSHQFYQEIGWYGL
jgi:hypothetical protein